MAFVKIAYVIEHILLCLLIVVFALSSWLKSTQPDQVGQCANSKERHDLAITIGVISFAVIVLNIRGFLRLGLM
jgi:hypothetical protein